MTPSNTPANTAPGPAPRPEPRHGHIGDLPNDILARILTWELLVHGGLDAVADFIVAAPFLAFRAGLHTDLLAACGIDETQVSWQQDVDFWQKFFALRRYQNRQRR